MFDDIHALLGGFDAERMSREDWRRMLFGHGWRSESDPYGYVLTESGHVAGFIGTLYSRQTIRGRARRFCNLSSWIVKKEHRLQGLHMLARVLADEETTYTGLTLIGATTKIFHHKGFQDLEHEALVISPLSAFASLPSLKGLSYTADLAEIEGSLRGDERAIFDAHRGARCNHLLLRWRDGHCYVLSTTWRLKGRPVGHVHYMSDPERFFSRMGAAQWALLRAHKLALLMVDRRQAPAKAPPLSLRYRLPQPRLYRPARSDGLVPREVTGLFSELMWLRV